ncbi:MAG: hypothetical protein ABEN55_00065 [Bradymonadaceae bacterium]
MSSTDGDRFDEFKSQISDGKVEDWPESMRDQMREELEIDASNFPDGCSPGRPATESGKFWALQALHSNLLFLGYDVDASDENAIVETALEAIDDLRVKGPVEAALRDVGRYADGALRAGLRIAGIVLEGVADG